MHYFCFLSGWLYPPKGEGKNQRKWSAPWEFNMDKCLWSNTKASCLTNLSKMFASIHLHANNLRWLCRVWWTKPGDKEFTFTIFGAVIFTSPNKGQCCRGVSNSPSQPGRKGWQTTAPMSLARTYIRSKLLSLSAGNGTASGTENL